MDDEDKPDNTDIEILLLILIVVCMRGCHHVGSTHELLKHQTQETTK
jgi:hypothetical protein